VQFVSCERTGASINDMGVQGLDHVGVVVDDLEAATAFLDDIALIPRSCGSPRTRKRNMRDA